MADATTMAREGERTGDGADLKAGSQVVGAGYRAVVLRDGDVVWTCQHVHFTDHSAKADAEAQVAVMAREGGAPGAG